MRRLVAILLLALLPLQSSWAAVALYCGHTDLAGATHFGHHEHRHPANTVGIAEPVAELGASAVAQSDQAPVVTDQDCGHCHGTCSALLTAPLAVPGGLLTAHPSATLDEVGGAHTPTRPERPQWPPLA